MENEWERVVCRPALPQDKAGVLEMARHIWDGQDYIPYVWDEWIKDPHGVLIVAELGGRVIGLGKLTRLDEGEWWMEGLRVHPEMQGTGVASRLNDYLLAAWQRFGGGVVRLGTSSQRKPVHHLCERNGFHKLCELAPFIAEALEGVHGFTPLAAEDAAAVMALTGGLPPVAPGFTVMNLFWRWAAPSAARLAEFAGKGNAWRWRDRGLVVVTQNDDDEEEGGRKLVIRYAACPPEELPALLHDVRRLAWALGLPRAGWWAPLDVNLEGALAQAGYRRDWEHALFLYEKNYPMV
ncbi:MAG: GNAT family N-acetyltransferase [Chloroflexi bacterium]|nr:GNAT family N-acetyltransferase [Chloroflexota bacterium]